MHPPDTAGREFVEGIYRDERLECHQDADDGIHVASVAHCENVDVSEMAQTKQEANDTELGKR